MESTAVRRRHHTRTTRSSLLSRLGNLEDSAAWGAFAEMYRGYVMKIAQAGGMSVHDADDVAQDVLIQVSISIQDFQRRSGRGAFRRWLRRLVRWRTEDQRRRNARRGAIHAEWEGDSDEVEAEGARAWVLELAEAVQEPAVQLEREGRIQLLEMALFRLQNRFDAMTLQIYDWYVIQEVAVPRIMEFFQVKAGYIYMIKSRMTRHLRRELVKVYRELYSLDYRSGRPPCSRSSRTRSRRSLRLESSSSRPEDN